MDEPEERSGADAPRTGVRMTHVGFLLRQHRRLVHALTDRVTSDANLFVVTHMGLAEVEPASWRLRLDGLVRKPCDLTWAALDGLPKVEVTSVHECAGSPLTPTEPKRRVGNVRWSGVRLRDVLDLAGVRPEATFVWTEGLEWGSFADVEGEPFVKDLPLAKARGDEVLLATGMNGEPLTSERGGPVRLVVPGWYGTNSVKWVGRVTLAARRAPGPFTTRFYNDPSPEGPRPVWGLSPECVIVRPSPDAGLVEAEVVVIDGWAWDEIAVASVEVSTDGGRRWHVANLEPRDGFAWQRFEHRWVPTAGEHRLLCRCTNERGTSQPAAGARNAVHEVTVKVEPAT